jgi:hypothetical protein
MKLVALIRAPAQPEEAVRALAEAAAITLAEARMRLAPEPPALLARFDAAAAEVLAANLRARGLVALAVDARVPTDADRLVARSFSLDVDAARFTPRAGEALAVPWSEIAMILRAVRTVRSESEHTEKSKRLSIGKAVVTGGLMFTKTTERTVRTSEEAVEQLVLVYPRSGSVVALAETQLEFTGLGALQPSRTANMAELARRLRERAPGAFSDDRLLRLGRRTLPFVAASESRIAAGGFATTRSDTATTVDVLAEVLWRALNARLLAPGHGNMLNS